MYKWGAYVKITGFDFSLIKRVDFSITAGQYLKIQKALESLEPLESCDFYPELVESAKSSVFLGAGDAEIDEIYIDDPGAIMRLKKRFEGRTFGWYADNTDNECEFEYTLSDGGEYTQYSLMVCFDKNGTVTNIKDVTAMSLETKDGMPTVFVENYPDYETIAICLENDLTKIHE